MGRYIDKEDIYNVFGKVNVAKWSNLDNRDESYSPDVARITVAIAYAEDYVDARLAAGVYAVPVEDPPSLLVDITAKIAGVWLYQSRGIDDFADQEDDPIARHKVEAERTINRILRGEIGLGAVMSGVHTTHPKVIQWPEPV